MLKEKLRFKNIELANRIAMPPMATGKAADDGSVTEEMLKYYAEKAEGGYIGLIITEFSYIMRQGKAGPKQLSICDDCDLEGLKKLTATVKKDGSIAFAQINHAGSAANTKESGEPAVAPSAVKRPGREDSSELPRELSIPEIKHIEDEFVRAAVCAKDAGYDGVELHAAHGYLFCQFYSPLTNRRTDEYGGSLENRMRALLETVKKVRAAVGEDYPLAVRLGGCDYMEGGSTIEDAVKASVMLEEAGVDLIDLSGGFCYTQRKDNTDPGYFSDMSEAVKKAVHIPVLVTGGVVTGAQAEELLQAGKADIIGVGRAILKDSSWAKTALAEV